MNILRGNDAPDDKYPYVAVVSIQYNRKHECGGSIIAEQWILTASHCVNRYLLFFIFVN